MAQQLPSGRWRARIRDPRNGGTHIAAHKIVGGASTYPTRREAERAEDRAREMALDQSLRGETVRGWWETWTTDPLWARKAGSTNIHNRERTWAFTDAYADRPLRSIDSLVVRDWLAGGKRNGTVPALRAMFNDARKPQAGMLVDANPFANLGIKRGKGRKYIQPPSQGNVAALIRAGDELTPPSFAAYLLTATWSAARPGELDGLQWADLDFQGESIRIERQWNAAERKITPPKHDSRRTIAMTEPVRDRLLELPRESEYVFTTLRGTHYTPSSRTFHWNRVRCTIGLPQTSLYEATRHYFAWYALNVLGLEPHVIALQLGHDDGGELVRRLYGHPDAAIARDKIREAFRTAANVAAIRVTA